MLAGAWVPVRKGEWKARVIGIPHAARAAMPHTKMVYDSTGNGKGWVGDVHVKVRCTHWRETSSAPRPSPCSGRTAGRRCGDGTLEVRYPSSGILEYWKRSGGGDPRSGEKAGKTPTNTSFAAANPLLLEESRLFPEGRQAGYWLALGACTWRFNMGSCWAAHGDCWPTGCRCWHPVPCPSASNGARLSNYDGFLLMH